MPLANRYVDPGVDTASLARRRDIVSHDDTRKRHETIGTAVAFPEPRFMPDNDRTEWEKMARLDTTMRDVRPEAFREGPVPAGFTGYVPNQHRAPRYKADTHRGHKRSPAAGVGHATGHSARDARGSQRRDNRQHRTAPARPSRENTGSRARARAAKTCSVRDVGNTATVATSASHGASAWRVVGAEKVCINKGGRHRPPVSGRVTSVHAKPSDHGEMARPTARDQVGQGGKGGGFRSAISWRTARPSDVRMECVANTARRSLARAVSVPSVRDMDPQDMKMGEDRGPVDPRGNVARTLASHSVRDMDPQDMKMGEDRGPVDPRGNVARTLASHSVRDMDPQDMKMGEDRGPVDPRGNVVRTLANHSVRDMDPQDMKMGEDRGPVDPRGNVARTLASHSVRDMDPRDFKTGIRRGDARRSGAVDTPVAFRAAPSQHDARPDSHREHRAHAASVHVDSTGGTWRVVCCNSDRDASHHTHHSATKAELNVRLPLGLREDPRDARDNANTASTPHASSHVVVKQARAACRKKAVGVRPPPSNPGVSSHARVGSQYMECKKNPPATGIVGMPCGTATARPGPIRDEDAFRRSHRANRVNRRAKRGKTAGPNRQYAPGKTAARHIESRKRDSQAGRRSAPRFEAMMEPRISRPTTSPPSRSPNRAPVGTYVSRERLVPVTQ